VAAQGREIGIEVVADALVEAFAGLCDGLDPIGPEVVEVFAQPSPAVQFPGATPEGQAWGLVFAPAAASALVLVAHMEQAARLDGRMQQFDRRLALPAQPQVTAGHQQHPGRRQD
jgi:hypothetical protein